MMNPYFLEEYAKAHQREMLREAELWRIAHQAKTAKNAGPGPLKRFINSSDTLLKKIVVRGKRETLSADERLVLNNNA
jgi:hypothetical protein